VRNNNSAKSGCIKSVQDELGFMNVHVAESGCVFELNEEEFCNNGEVAELVDAIGTEKLVEIGVGSVISEVNFSLLS